MPSRGYKWKIRPERLDSGQVVQTFTILDDDEKTWRPPTEEELLDLMGSGEMPHLGSQGPIASVGYLPGPLKEDEEEDRALGFPRREDL